MKNKYYTPEIEEFHMGFEYEYLPYNKDYDTYMTPWIKATPTEITVKGFKDQLYGLRVKYLDQEDIESLDWEFTGRSIDIWFKKEGHFDLGWNAFKIILHYGLHDNKLTIHANDSGEDYILFRGLIKNKSELIKLMKQLGI